jgi:hypothetical protein
MSRWWLLAAFAGGAVLGAIATKLYIQGEIKDVFGQALDKIGVGDYGGPVKDLWNGLVDDKFSVGGKRESSVS